MRASVLTLAALGACGRFGFALEPTDAEATGFDADAGIDIIPTPFTLELTGASAMLADVASCHALTANGTGYVRRD